jgi:hypothetical protein
MENAQWDLTPDAVPTGGTSYGVRLYTANTGLSASDDDQFFAVKRPSFSTSYADWISLDGSTTVPSAGSAGRIYNSGIGYAERLGYTSFSKFGIAKILSPLPIELLNFTATPLEDKVRLNWTTSTETNNDHFTIEHSPDAINFSSIAIVKGAGNSTSIKNYMDFDLHPYSGINYYRLKQTDFNGAYSYSEIISVMMTMPFNEYIFPNPATNFLNIRITESKQIPVIFEVINIQGITLMKKGFESTEETDFSINLQEFAQGTYILKTTIGNKTKQTLFVKE